MAITRTYINGDTSTLVSFLESSGLFDSVTAESSTITCKDADNNTMLIIAPEDIGYYGNQIGVYASSSVAETIHLRNNSYNTYFIDGYSCANGVILQYGSTQASDYNACLLITKTNNDAVAVVVSSSATTIPAAYTSFYAVAWGDTAPISAYTTAANAQNQTMLVPFATNANEGAQSYTPNAGFMISGQLYSLGYGKATIGSGTYITNGYWAIKDGAES
jgi:hypothetical protein